MRILVFSLIFLLSSCSTQSKESMQKEYDSVVKVIEYDTATINILMNFKNKDMETIRQIDSLKIDGARLEKRKKELAESLFK
jgi:hypothetical protein